MSDGEALLAAILANPDDDAPRLIYSDWLEENGDEARAEFIRVQCEYTRNSEELMAIPTSPYSRPGSRHSDLINRQASLVFRGREAWFSNHPKWGISQMPDYQQIFVRGFAHAISITASQWINHADEILAQHPVREATLTTWPNWFYETSTIGEWVDTDEPWLETFRGERQTTEASARIFHTKAAYRWPGITFHLPALTPEEEIIHGTGENLPMGTINVEEESDAAPAPRESAAQRARQLEFTGRHRRQRNR